MVLAKGSRRIRALVRVAIAFASAGATDGTETSPTPVGLSVDSMRWMIRSTWTRPRASRETSVTFALG
jgi:hypothetical protein